jgi:probable HAF family extracellular repeat protein
MHRITIPGPADRAGNALAVNDAGVAVVNAGVLGDTARLRTWVWRNGQATLLPTLPGGGGTAGRRINDRGDVVGNAIAADGHTHPVLWRHGTITDLGLPAGMSDGFAFGVNAEGEVSGSVLTSPDDVGHGQANVVDDRGRAAGRSDDFATGLSTAAWWASDGALHDLGLLDPDSVDPLSWVFATDGRGDWGGAGSSADGTPTAFVSRLDGPLLRLPGLDGGAMGESYVHGLDPRGDAAGQSTTATGELHATLWTCAFAQAR